MPEEKKSLLLKVNGQGVDFPGGSLEALLDHLGMEQAAVVAEVNGSIIPPADFAVKQLAEGDTIELVRFVGGG